MFQKSSKGQICSLNLGLDQAFTKATTTEKNTVYLIYALPSISDGTKKGRETWMKNEKKKEAGDEQKK